MAHKTAEMRKGVLRVLEESGAQEIKFGRDGASHQTATFLVGKESLRFHFPATGKTRGCTYINVIANLKRQIRASTLSQAC